MFHIIWCHSVIFNWNSCPCFFKNNTYTHILSLKILMWSSMGSGICIKTIYLKKEKISIRRMLSFHLFGTMTGSFIHGFFSSHPFWLPPFILNPETKRFIHIYIGFLKINTEWIHLMDKWKDWEGRTLDVVFRLSCGV